jgi:hypothetical protein
MSLNVYLNAVRPICVFNYNITHNLYQMAKEAGISEHLWDPNGIGIKTAEQLIEPIANGLALLESDPQRFKKFNSENGWGTYEGLVKMLRLYLEACKENPDAEVSVSK